MIILFSFTIQFYFETYHLNYKLYITITQLFLNLFLSVLFQRKPFYIKLKSHSTHTYECRWVTVSQFSAKIGTGFLATHRCIYTALQKLFFLLIHFYSKNPTSSVAWLTRRINVNSWICIVCNAWGMLSSRLLVFKAFELQNEIGRSNWPIYLYICILLLMQQKTQCPVNYDKIEIGIRVFETFAKKRKN